MYGILLIICVLVEIYCFQKQRAALEIGRVLGFDARKLILPPWFIITWILPIITMYCISQTFSIAWYFSIIIYLIYMIIYSLLPKLYITSSNKLIQSPQVIVLVGFLYLNVKQKRTHALT